MIHGEKHTLLSKIIKLAFWFSKLYKLRIDGLISPTGLRVTQQYRAGKVTGNLSAAFAESGFPFFKKNHLFFCVFVFKLIH